jgi:hypothetical protein
MRQQDYEMIIACIQHGAPALAQVLINALNQVIESSNELREIKRAREVEAREPRKAEMPDVKKETK